MPNSMIKRFLPVLLAEPDLSERPLCTHQDHVSEQQCDLTLAGGWWRNLGLR